MATEREPHRQPVVDCTDYRVFRACSLDCPVLTVFCFSAELRRHPAASCAIQAIEP